MLPPMSPSLNRGRMESLLRRPSPARGFRTLSNGSDGFEMRRRQGTTRGAAPLADKACLDNGREQLERDIRTQLHTDVKLSVLLPWQTAVDGSVATVSKEGLNGEMLPAVYARQLAHVPVEKACNDSSRTTRGFRDMCRYTPASLNTGTMIDVGLQSGNVDACELAKRNAKNGHDANVESANMADSMPVEELQARAEELLQANAEREALEQTLNPHYVLIGAELEIAENSLAVARLDSKQADMVVHVDGKRKGSIIKTSGFGDALMSFIPNTLRRCLKHGLVHLDQWKVLLESPLKSSYNPVLSRFPAAVVFADASGFTKLTDTLARRPQGAEEIGSTLNGFFGPLIGLVHKHGGDIVKFSGDALTIIWAAAEPASSPHKEADQSKRFDRQSGCRPDKSNALFSRSHSSDCVDGSSSSSRMSGQAEQLGYAACAVEAAARFCIEVQEEVEHFGQTPVPECDLTLHIGVGYGHVALLQVGGLMGRWEYCIAGPPIDQISIAEPLAASGETVFSPEARSLVAECFAFEEINTSGFAKLVRANKPADMHTSSETLRIPPWWHPESVADQRLVKRYVPSAVAVRLSACANADSVIYPEEMRRVSVVFLSIADLDPSKGPPSNEPHGLSGGGETQLCFRLMQRSVYALEGSVNKFLVDDKGVLLLVVFGLPPLIHFTDDPIRAVLCAMRLCNTLRDEGLQGRVGVATGQCWCGVVGTEQRREYTVLGDTVNLAARLMGKAPPSGVLVDTATQDVASQIVDFEDGGYLHLKGKPDPVRAFRFLRTRRGLLRHRKEMQQSLLTWGAWPARHQVHKALDRNAHQSSVLFVVGTGGVGKTELADEVRKWTAAHGWTLLYGQNMDPTGIFALPRLSLQEAFLELVYIAAKDPFWRSKAWELMKSSLGEASGCEPAKERDPQSIRRPPGHAELYWMLVAMIQESVGVEAAAELEEWTPLLSLIITQLAFAPRMVSAILERDEQHSKSNRFAELATAVLDGFSRCGDVGRGTVVVLHIRRSTAFFQSSDLQESATIRAISELCMRRRQQGPPDGEVKPLIICIVSRETVLKDGAVYNAAQNCSGLVEANDLDLWQTTAYIRHLLHPGIVKSSTEEACSKLDDEDLWGTQVVAEYVYEMTGGNPLGVGTMITQLEKHGILQRAHVAAAVAPWKLTPECTDAEWLRKAVPLPESLVGMAFSSFEHLDPREQMVLKAASTFEANFGLRELRAALPGIAAEDLVQICQLLAAPTKRVLRIVQRFNDAEKPRRRLSKAQSEGLDGARSQSSAWSPKNGRLETIEDEPCYKFYSGLLRHVASTLVLETQRTEVRRNTVQAMQLELLSKNLAAISDLHAVEEYDTDYSESGEDIPD